uniref:Uncharacterized protein n=1 Tax=uncultured Vibrionales bacterium HF0010_22E23 TaxID=710999 RepID=E0XRJ3_9GAMM|nr:hypothetical protein [uncultured Vibrionales bacterium HF0010_22E23]
MPVKRKNCVLTGTPSCASLPGVTKVRGTFQYIQIAKNPSISAEVS